MMPVTELTHIPKKYNQNYVYSKYKHKKLQICLGVMRQKNQWYRNGCFVYICTQNKNYILTAYIQIETIIYFTSVRSPPGSCQTS